MEQLPAQRHFLEHVGGAAGVVLAGSFLAQEIRQVPPHGAGHPRAAIPAAAGQRPGHVGPQRRQYIWQITAPRPQW